MLHQRKTRKYKASEAFLFFFGQILVKIEFQIDDLRSSVGIALDDMAVCPEGIH